MKFHYFYHQLCLVAALVVSITVCSCKKFVDIDAPIDSINTASAYNSDLKTASVLRSLYASMVKSTNYAFGNAVSVGLGVSSDELIPTSTASIYNDFYINQINASNTSLGYYWGPMYNIIYTANAVIENVPKSTGMTEAGKRQSLAEARFIRAANYFYLINIFGDVPLVTGTDYAVNAKLARTPVSEIYQLIISDLKLAEADLGTAYIGTQRLRANKYAVAALLARVYLYRQDWTNAVAEATAVIAGKDATGAPLYNLESNLNNAFLLSSKEPILQLQQSGTLLYTWEAFAFVQSGTPTYQLSDALYNTFTTGDARKSSWVKTYTVTTSGITKNYYSPYKYKISSGTGSVKTESMVFLRLAEQYLIRAEANAQLNNLSAAIADLDIVRKRAGLTVATDPATNQAGLLALIARERFLELFAEQGHRWLDLKRTAAADVVLKNKPNWRPEAKLFPIPLTEMNVDPAIVQNPGY